tara:strand:- start:1463 stop:2317 length:855 start_codon:yes stop_codon:yes gene_type:complete
MIIALTGSTGFIGSEIKNYLKNNNHIFVEISSNELHDLSTEKLKNKFKAKKIKTLIHCAGIAHKSSDYLANNTDKLFLVNCEITKKLCEASVASSVDHFIFLSTIGVYGSNYDRPCLITRESPIAPSNLYSYSKFVAENYIVSTCQSTTTKYTILRCPLVYSHKAPGNLHRLSSLIKLHIPLPLGKISNKRSYIHLNTIVKSIVSLALKEKLFNKIYLPAEKIPLSTKEIIQLLSYDLNIKSHIYSLPEFILDNLMRIFRIHPKWQKLTATHVVEDDSFHSDIL